MLSLVNKKILSNFTQILFHFELLSMRKVFSVILFILCGVCILSLVVNPNPLTLPFTLLYIYFFALNGYILFFKEKDTSIAGWKKVLFYFVELLICMFIGSAIGGVALNSQELTNWIAALGTFGLTILYPANKFFKTENNGNE